jgi:hypothetical protein
MSNRPLVTLGGRLRSARGLVDVVHVTVLESPSVSKAKAVDGFRSYVAKPLRVGRSKKTTTPTRHAVALRRARNCSG